MIVLQRLVLIGVSQYSAKEGTTRTDAHILRQRSKRFAEQVTMSTQLDGLDCTLNMPEEDDGGWRVPGGG